MNSPILLLIVAMSFTFINPCDHKGREATLSSPSEDAVLVQVENSELKSVPKIVTADATVLPSQVIDVKATCHSTVNTVLVHEGDRVKAGDLLLTLAPEPIEDDLNNLKLSLQETDARAAQIQKRIAEKSATAAPNPEDVEFFDEIPNQDQPSNDSTYGDQNDAPQAESYRDLAAALDARSLLLKNKIASTEALLLNLSVTAPVEGLVSKVLVATTNPIKFQDTLVQISVTNPMTASFYVPASEASFIDTASPINITLSDNSSVSLDGTISYIDANIDASLERLLVKANFNNDQGLIKGGQTVLSELTTRHEMLKPVILSSALTSSEGISGVFTIFNGHAKFLQVRNFKKIDATHILLIDSDAIAEDPIITNPTKNLKNNTPVRVLPAK